MTSRDPVSWDPGLGATEHSGAPRAGHTASLGAESTPGLGRGPAGTTGRCGLTQPVILLAGPAQGRGPVAEGPAWQGHPTATSPAPQLASCPGLGACTPALQNHRPCHSPSPHQGQPPRWEARTRCPRQTDKGPESAGAHGPTWEASLTAEVQGSGAGPGFRDTALCSQEGQESSSDIRRRGGREGPARTCTGMRSRAHTAMHTHGHSRRHTYRCTRTW